MSHSRPLSGRCGKDAIALLIEDHQKIRKLFQAFASLEKDTQSPEKNELVQEICKELIVHLSTEEQAFYPPVQAAMDDDDVIRQALVEHARAKDLVQQLSHLSPINPLYDAVVTVLSQYIGHYIAEEELLMFPLVKKLKLDLFHIGIAMQARKEKIKAQLETGAPFLAVSNPWHRIQRQH